MSPRQGANLPPPALLATSALELSQEPHPRGNRTPPGRHPEAPETAFAQARESHIPAGRTPQPGAVGSRDTDTQKPGRKEPLCLLPTRIPAQLSPAVSHRAKPRLWVRVVLLARALSHVTSMFS